MKTTLEESAYNNLKFLQNKELFLSNKYSIQNQLFINKEGESFDTIYSFADLEYPIFFTFHQILNHVNTSYNNKFMSHSKQEVIHLLETALETLFEYNIQIDEKNEHFEQLLDDLDEKIFFIKQYYKYGICLGLPTFIKNMLNSTCSSFIEVSRTICSEYIQELKDPGYYDTKSDSEEETSDEDIPDLEEDDKKSN
jgi:hypothetical protein